MKTVTAVYVLSLMAAVMSSVSAESPREQFAGMVENGSADLSLRYRYEGVNQDNPLDNARASTLRTRLTLETAEVAGAAVLLEVDNVTALGEDRYDSLVNDKYRGTYSVIADPVGTEVNQVLLRYRFSPELAVSGGRQRILHGNQRFVGGVGWRQNEQTYDAATLGYEAGGISIDYGYLWRVNRIFDGRDSSVQEEEFDSDSHILLATGKIPLGTLKGFVYALDFDNAPALSSTTYGLGYSGSFGPLSLDASYGIQSDYADNPASFDTYYLALEGRLAVDPVTFTLGFERLGSDGGDVAFTTPLATLHAFQGWTDTFLSTPANGIDDIYLGLAGKLGKLSLAAKYHDFSAHRGSESHGSEIDLVATYPLMDNLSLQLKYADYNADDFGVDTEKYWLTLNLSL